MNKPSKKINWDEGEEVEAPQFAQPVYYRKQCESCWQLFDTTTKWSRRCPDCKAIDAPYQKKIYSDSPDSMPF